MTWTSTISYGFIFHNILSPCQLENHGIWIKDAWIVYAVCLVVVCALLECHSTSDKVHDGIHISLCKGGQALDENDRW